MSRVDDYFQEVAYSMGHKPEDLLSIDREIVELESAPFLKAMSQKER